MHTRSLFKRALGYEAVHQPSGLKVLVGVLALFGATAYYVFEQPQFNLFTYNTFLLAAIGAIALNILMGSAGQVSIGTAAFLAVGGFTVVYSQRAGLPFPVDILLGAIACGIAGFFVGLPGLRLRGFYLALSTLAFHFIALYFFGRYQSNEVGSSGFLTDTLFKDKKLLEQQQSWAWLLFIVVSVVIVGAALITRGRTGRALRLIRDHEHAAVALGIPATRYKQGAFVGTSMLIGIEGGLTVYLLGALSVENFTFLLAVSYIAMILIGGLDSILGSVLGAALITFLPIILPDLLEPFFSGSTVAGNLPQISTIVYGALVIFFITRSADGLAGWIRDLRQAATRLVRRAGPRQRHGGDEVSAT